MDNHQHSLSVTPPSHVNGVDDNLNAMMSAIGRSGISVDSSTDRAEGVRFDGRFEMALAPSTSLAPWARHESETDIDAEILRWIISHVPSRKRSKSH
jgi:hypothetical protein